MNVFKIAMAWDGEVYSPGDPVPASLSDGNHLAYQRFTQLGYIGPAELITSAADEPKQPNGPKRVHVIDEQKPRKPKNKEAENAG